MYVQNKPIYSPYMKCLTWVLFKRVFCYVKLLPYPCLPDIPITTTRKYLLRGYILGVLTHTTALDEHRGGDETLKLFLVYVAWLLLS